MRCPFCSNTESQVKDSRPTEDNSAIRRRRSCLECGARFTTFERVQLREITVLKAGDRRQPFDRDKLTRSLQIALRKRPVELEQIEKAVTSIVRQMESTGEHEINSRQIGGMVMAALARLDTVAYVRFASVYKDFSQAQDFNEILAELKDLRGEPDKDAAK